ncbi:MAG: DUF1848 domain-containing protein [Gracilibacteraceae bacterium]|jgi:hypothetical protein|nr:DUF1848 domain-containing protein [Gracilibacteraceae bacterium]
MIISASRRTDIPAYYAGWLFNRLKEGCVLVRNPANIHQVSRISLSPADVEGIVFWTKNPIPMLDKLALLRDYAYYFQFTITSYGTDVEPNIPDKRKTMIPAFRHLSDLIGAGRVVWRYDPIMLGGGYTADYHFEFFEKTARQLSGYTKKCVISFVDHYRSMASRVKNLRLLSITTENKQQIAQRLAEIARGYGLQIEACAEETDLSRFGLGRARCVDSRLFGRSAVSAGKDKNQRSACDCDVSADIGMYDSCRGGCLYCYASHSEKALRKNIERHNPSSPLLCGEAGEKDIVRERKAARPRKTGCLRGKDGA